MYITVGGIIGGGSGRETSQNLQKGDAFVSNPHTDQAHLIDPVVLFLFFFVKTNLIYILPPLTHTHTLQLGLRTLVCTTI